MCIYSVPALGSDWFMCSSHCKTCRINGSHEIGLVVGFRVRIMVKFRVMIRARAWSGMTLCPCTFCSDPCVVTTR